MTLLLSVFSCGKNVVSPQDSGGFPALPRIRYELIDGAGTDSWFAKAKSITTDSVLFQATYRDGTTQRHHPFFLMLHSRLCFKDAMDAFTAEAQPVNSPAYINNRLVYLGKLDVDTLRIEVLPANFRNDQEVMQLRFYYNGRLSADYDFRANPSLRDSLYTKATSGLIVPLHKFGRPK